MNVRAFRRSIAAAALLVAVTGGVTVAVTSSSDSPTHTHTAVVRVDGGTNPTPDPSATPGNTIWD
ncbi:hypothetical protein AB0M29_36165 [Streptomyces sp. NPDC051976]|uniref:hypothetical protein n=1 Tax=Streptomyces sp. NPDC051976 TaxID=3154947 RepID=UPI0034190183